MTSYCRIMQTKRIMSQIIDQYENIEKCLLRISSKLNVSINLPLSKKLTSSKRLLHSPSKYQARHFHVLPRCNDFKTTDRKDTCLARKHTSSLFVSDAVARNTAPVEIDLEIEKKVAKREELKRNLMIRGIQFDVDTFVEDYRLMKRLEKEKSRLETEREKVAKKMAELKKQQTSEDTKESKESLISRGKQIKEALKELQLSWWVWEEKVLLSALRLPNDIRDHTPDDKPHIVASYGEIPDMSKARCHLDIAEEMDLVKFSSAGPRAYYLKGKLASQEQSLLQSASDHLSKNNFHLLSCPEIFRSLVVEGCGVDYKNKIFTLQEHDGDCGSRSLTLDDFTHVQGVSLMSFAAFMARTVVKTSNLPHRLYTVGRQYIPEPDPDLPGLFGVTQSMKTAFVSVCHNNLSCVREFNKIVTLLWNMYHSLQVHMRLVLVPGKDLLQSESIRTEIQIWAPSLKHVKTYVTVAHISCVDDYVSRRLMCYHSNSHTDYKDFQYLHMVYGEAVDVTRLLAVLLEHNAVDKDWSDLPHQLAESFPEFQLGLMDI